MPAFEGCDYNLEHTQPYRGVKINSTDALKGKLDKSAREKAMEDEPSRGKIKG